MSNIKLKNKIKLYENPKSVFNDEKMDYKYVVNSEDSNVLIFAKDKKFFKNRKSYVKKLLISDDCFEKEEKKSREKTDIEEKTSELLSETISNINKENIRLKEICDNLATEIINRNNTVNKLNNLKNSISLNVNRYYISLINTSFVDRLTPGSYFIQQLDEINPESTTTINIFKLPDNAKPTIYNIICVGIFVVEFDSENMIKLVDYRNYNYGMSYLSIAKTKWGFKNAFTTLLKEKPIIEIYKNNIIKVPEKMPIYDINDENADNKLIVNIDYIVGANRVKDAFFIIDSNIYND